MVAGLSDGADGGGAQPGDAELASALSSRIGAQAVEGLDINAVSRFASVLRSPPVFNYQTVYGVIMIPDKQVIIPIN